MKELTRLAEFVGDLTFDDLPADVVERAKWVLRDTIGVTLAGLAEPENSALADHAIAHYPGPAQIFGRAGKTAPAWAVLVHGTAGTTLEMDEGHAFARGHAAVHAVGPALALAEEAGISGEQLLAALVAGYEVAARAGVATRLRGAVHPFGAWGVLGAAAIAARCKQMPAADIAGVLEVAASYAITPSFETAYQGANVRNTYAGVVNRLGLLAAELYVLGFRGEDGGLQTAFGEILGQSFDPGALIEELGSRYEITRGYFKPYSGCRYTHAAIDAVLNLLAENTFSVDDIQGVRVETYDLAARLSDPDPQTPLAGRFSTPFVVAATLTHGSAGPEIFAPEVLHDPQIRGLASRVRVQEDPALTALTPRQRPARVAVTLRNQTVYQESVTGSKGDPDQPMTPDELHAKFHALAEPVLGPAQASHLWELIGRVESLSDLSSLFRALVPGEIKEGGVHG